MDGTFSSNAVWYLMRSSGVVSLALLTAVFVLGIATFRHWRPPRLPRFVTVGLHRAVSLTAVTFLAFHVVMAGIDPYAAVGIAALAVPFIAGRDAFAVGLGALSLDLVAALIVSSLVRVRLGTKSWRAIHTVAYLALPLALAHSFGTGSDAGSPWFVALGGGCVAAIVAAVAWRVVAPRGVKHLEPQPPAGRDPRGRAEFTANSQERPTASQAIPSHPCHR